MALAISKIRKLDHIRYLVDNKLYTCQFKPNANTVLYITNHLPFILQFQLTRSLLDAFKLKLVAVIHMVKKNTCKTNNLAVHYSLDIEYRLRLGI